MHIPPSVASANRPNSPPATMPPKPRIVGSELPHGAPVPPPFALPINMLASIQAKKLTATIPVGTLPSGNKETTPSTTIPAGA